MIKFELMSLCGVTREVLLKTGAALSSCVAVGSLDMEAVCCAWGDRGRGNRESRPCSAGAAPDRLPNFSTHAQEINLYLV